MKTLPVASAFSEQALEWALITGGDFDKFKVFVSTHVIFSALRMLKGYGEIKGFDVSVSLISNGAVFESAEPDFNYNEGEWRVELYKGGELSETIYNPPL